MENFDITVISDAIDESFLPLIRVMQSLKKFPEFPFEAFYNLVTSCLDEPSICFDSSALSAGQLGAVVRPGRRLELVIAALLALESYLHS